MSWNLFNGGKNYYMTQKEKLFLKEEQKRLDETTADVVRGSGGLQRTIDFELGFTLGAENQYATSTTLSHGQTALPRDFPFVNEYPKDWLEGYGLLDFVPRSLTDGRRYGLGTTHTFRPESGITLELGWKAEGSQALGNESPWVLGATQDIELSVGSDSDLSWSFAYSRRGSARSGGNDFLNLRADFSLLATRAALLPQALISLPLWDLVSPWEEDAFIAGLPQEFLSYFSEPRLSVTLRRRIGGTVADLYLPSFVALETARKTDTGVEAPPDQRSWAARVGFTPINMFGTQGLLPKSTTFSSDEYTLDLGWRTLSFGDSLRPIHGTTLALGARFYGLGRADLIQNQVQVPGLGSEYLPYTLSLSQSFDLTIADSYGLAANLKAGFPWSSPLPPTPETILPLTQNEEWQLVHNEGITFQVQGTWGSRSLGSDPESLGWFEEGAKNSDQGYLGSADFVPWSPSRPLSSMYLIHETILTLPYTGYFRGFVELGWRGTLTTGQEKWSHHIGGRIGVEILLEL